MKPDFATQHFASAIQRDENILLQQMATCEKQIKKIK